jgi:flavin-dependent dehydrogenase
MSASLDAVIIGGGPAGTSFAFSAAQRGMRVALFEKASIPFRKVCGGVLSPRCWKTIQKLAMEEAVADLPFQELRRLYVEVDSGPELEIPFPGSEIPSRVVDRSLLDAALWNFAKKANASLYDKTLVKEISREGDLWRIKTFRDHDELFYAKILIGADGRNSFVAHQLGIQARRLEKTVCYQYRLRSHDFAKDGVHFFLFDRGYCGLSIDGCGCCHLDVLSLQGKESDRELRDRLFSCGSRFVEKLKKAEFYPERPLARSPIGGGSRSKPSQQNAFLIGDAQRWFEPFTGEGIGLAMESALDLSRTLDPLASTSERTRDFNIRVSRTNWVISQILKSPHIARAFITSLKYFPSLSRAMAGDVLG